MPVRLVLKRYDNAITYTFCSVSNIIMDALLYFWVLIRFTHK